MLVFLTVLIWSKKVDACLIACLKSNNNMLVANHEDWFADNAAIRINPPEAGKYGSVTFTFLDEGWAQGGMNERGLFFDGAYTPYQEINPSPSANNYNGYIWQEVLNACKNVDEALSFLEDYKLSDLEESHIFLADSLGSAVILGVNNGKKTIKYLDKDYLIQTNFNPWQPELSDNETCDRFELANSLLSRSTSDTDNILMEVLKATHQDSLTVYSNIYDLRSKKISTFYQRRFDQPIEISLMDIFDYGNCLMSMESIVNSDFVLGACRDENRFVKAKGRVVDAQNNKPIPYVNIGLPDRGLGTLSDQGGVFEFEIKQSLESSLLHFSSVGYRSIQVPIDQLDSIIYLNASSKILDEVLVTDKKRMRVERLGYMGGKDGIIPLEVNQGGAVAALKLEAENVPFLLGKVQFRILYNSKDTLKFRLRLFGYDSINDQPGEELMMQNIILEDQKKFGWVRVDLSDYNIEISEPVVFVGLEWLNNQCEREGLISGLADWERWKNREFNLKNPKIEVIYNSKGKRLLKYHGDMRDWPGFNELPPWTGLMVETGKNAKTNHLKTYQRKVSFGKWQEIESTLNLVATIYY